MCVYAHLMSAIYNTYPVLQGITYERIILHRTLSIYAHYICMFAHATLCMCIVLLHMYMYINYVLVIWQQAKISLNFNERRKFSKIPIRRNVIAHVSARLKHIYVHFSAYTLWTKITNRVRAKGHYYPQSFTKTHTLLLLLLCICSLYY